MPAADAVVGQDVGVVLEVLAELAVGVGFEPGAQASSTSASGSWAGCVGVAVGQAAGRRLALGGGERHADQPRRQRVEAGGLGVEGGEAGGVDAGQPGVEGIPRQGSRSRCGGRRARPGAWQRFRLGGRRRGGAMDALLQLLQPALELHAPVDRGSAAVVLAGGQVGRPTGSARSVTTVTSLRPAAGNPGVCAGFRRPCRPPCRRWRRVVEGAVFGEPLDGRLGAALLDAGHVVDGVADQRQVVDDALGRHARTWR